MKHIKLFESINDDLGYEEIDMMFFNKIDNIYFNSKEVNRIVNNLDSGFKLKYQLEKYLYLYKSYPTSHPIIGKGFQSNIRLKDKIYLYKCLDDWYYVSIQYRKGPTILYKCDQWDSLLKLLTNKGVIKPQTGQITESISTDGYERAKGSFIHLWSVPNQIPFLKKDEHTLRLMGFYKAKYVDKHYLTLGRSSIGYLKVYRTEDDWYYVVADIKGKHSYKCDQFEGVLDCLKNEFDDFLFLYNTRY